MIQAFRLVPQELRWDFVPPGFAGPRRALQIFQDEARLLDCNFRLGISETTVDTGLRLLSDSRYTASIAPRIFRCVVVFIEA